jgi:3-methyladenine DNA glycosylase Tag
VYLNELDIRILDIIRNAVNDVALPSFWQTDQDSVGELTDKNVFRMIAEKRAYSAAQSRLVDTMIKNEGLKKAFADFNVSLAKELNSEDVLAEHWAKIKVIRFKKKVGEIIEAAKVIAEIGCEFGSFANYLERTGVPRRIKRQEDIGVFWEEFDNLRSDLKKRSLPIICNEITLLHFLESDLQLDCIKPDTIVMHVMINTGIIPSKGRGMIRLAVKKVQEYCLRTGIRPQLIDRYLLAFGGQTWAKDVVTKSYCRAHNSCDFISCPVGNARLCPASMVQEKKLS